MNDSDTPCVCTTPASTDGSFRISGLPAGRYYAAPIVTQMEAQSPNVDDLDVLIARATPVDLRDSEQKAITARID